MADGAAQAMNTLKTDDAAVQNALALLDSHTSFMQGMNATVDTIRQDINSCYQARSSTTFQGKVNEWIENYQAVQNAVRNLRDRLQTAHGVIGRAEEELAGNAASWNTSDASDPIYQALHG
jgi:uncharacterized protein YukE